MTVNFPEGLQGIYDFMQVFLMDIDSLGFSCSRAVDVHTLSSITDLFTSE